MAQAFTVEGFYVLNETQFIASMVLALLLTIYKTTLKRQLMFVRFWVPPLADE